MKLLLLRKSASKFCMKICGGTLPVKKLYLMSKKDKVGILRIEIGKTPESKLLLTSSSYRYLSVAIFGEMVPEKLLVFAWNSARSGS